MWSAIDKGTAAATSRGQLLGQRIALGLLCVAIAIFAVAASTQLGEITRKKLILLGGGGTIALLAIQYRVVKPVLLFLWVFAYTYNRAYFSFERFLGDFGPNGPYWVPADLFFVGLLAVWAWERLISKAPSQPVRGRPVWPWLAPYLAICLISLFGSERPMWGLFEFLRLLKLGLIFYYVRRNIGRNEWWIIVGAFVVATLVQASFGCLQMVLRSSGGLLTTLGIGAGSLEDAAAGQTAIGGWIRATGTLSHPTNLAAYLLLTMPLVFALALGARSKFYSLLCWGVTAVAFAGMVGTLCRWPTAVSAVLLTIVLAALTAERTVPVKRSFGIVALAGFLVLMGALPFADSLYRRLTEDLSDSVKFRQNYFRMAMQRLEPDPILGLGLSNFGVDMAKWDPDIDWALEKEPEARHLMHLRAFFTPHNFFLLILSETGVLGVMAFLVFLAGIGRAALRAFQRTSGELRCACAGLTVGMMGLVAHQLVDFTLWVDPGLFPFTICAALINVAEDVAA